MLSANNADSWTTADLCDAYLANSSAELRVIDLALTSYGGRHRYFGQVVLAGNPNDAGSRENIAPSLLPLVSKPGLGRILIVNASVDVALLGDKLAKMAVDNGWAGIVLNGHIRDSAILAQLPLGVHALATRPQRAVQSKPACIRDTLCIGHVRLSDTDWLYADPDGLIVMRHPYHVLTPLGSQAS